MWTDVKWELNFILLISKENKMQSDQSKTKVQQYESYSVSSIWDSLLIFRTSKGSHCSSLCLSFTVRAVCSVGSGWLHSTPATVIGSHPTDLSSSVGWSIRCSWASPSSIASPNLSLGALTSPHSARPQPFSMNPSLLGSLPQPRLPASVRWSPGLRWYQSSASLHAPFMSSKKQKTKTM